MANLDVTKVEGFEELNRKLKQLNDAATRKEILGIQRRLAKPVQQSYARNLPQRTGNLGRSVAVLSVSARRSGGNPSIVVRPGKRGKNDGYYKFMVIRKGDRPGSTKRGSRRGLNTVVEDARDKTLQNMGDRSATESADKMAKYIQKRINILSNA